VGPAGQYLDKWLAAIELDRRESCFIANVVKCRPPGNRDPNPDEVATCMPYLARQIDLLRPKALLAVGRVAANHLLGVTRTLAEHRSGRYEHRGRPLFVTYHPSAVLRDPSLRAPVWEDLQKLRAFLDQP
jgi:DNA polymerase